MNIKDLEELAKGQLPERVLKSVGKMQLTVDELVACYATPTFRFGVADGQAYIDIRGQCSLKRAIAFATGIAGFVAGMVKLISLFL